MIRTRVKRSIVWKSSDDEFKKLVTQSKSIGDICQNLSGRKGGSIFRNIKLRIEQLKLSTSHFIDSRIGKFNPTHVSKSEFLRRLEAKETMDPNFIKRKLVEFSLIPNECSECGLKHIWKQKPLVLILDHIDGDFLNNTIPNFRFLCPNCNSQTSSFSRGKRGKKEKVCMDCGREVSKNGPRCHKCGCIERERLKRILRHTSSQ